MTPFFSIIIPTFERPQQLFACLESLANLTYPGDRFEVIVVNDGGQTSLAATIIAFEKRLDITLLSQSNAGPAAARNFGVEKARGEFLAFTDDDCRPAPNWLQNLANYFEKKSDCMLGGRTVNILTKNPYSVASQLIVDLVYRYYNANPERARFFATNNLALPARRFQEVGGFDVQFHTSEDREFCDRWRHCDRQMIYVPTAVVYHAHKLTLRSFLCQHFNYGRGAYRYHYVRARRGSGTIWKDFGFYLNLKNWLFYPFFQLRLPKAISLFPLLIVWQSANAAGFLKESVSKKAKEQHICHGNVNEAT